MSSTSTSTLTSVGAAIKPNNSKKASAFSSPPFYSTTIYHHRFMLCEQIVKEVVISSANSSQALPVGANSGSYHQHNHQNTQPQSSNHQPTVARGSSSLQQKVPVPVLSPEYIKKFQNKKLIKKKQIEWSDERKAVSFCLGFKWFMNDCAWFSGYFAC